VKNNINGFKTNGKNKSIEASVLNKFKGYHHRTNLIRDENSELVVDYHSILVGGKITSTMINNVKQTEMHTPELLITEPCCFGHEIATENFKRYKSRCADKILAEIQVWDKILCSEIHMYIHSIWNMQELTQQWNESITVHHTCFYKW
jgi:hypothetical protein